MLSSPTSLLFTTLLLVASSITDANNSTIVPANFQELLAVPQGVTALRLGADCYSWMRTRVPNTMYTIQPNEDDSQESVVRVWTYPANLVKAKVDDVGTLEFEWNEEVASEAQEGGVFVTFPAAQFNRLAVSAGSRAQVLGGFTNIQALRVSSGATLYATVTQNSDALSSLEASSGGRVTVVSNVPVKDVSASSSGTVRVQAPGTLVHVKASSGGTVVWQGPGLVTAARVSSGGYIKLEGSLQDARLSSGSLLKVHNGNFTGHAEASSGSTLEIAGGSVESTASFELRSGSTVRAPQCIKVVTRSGGQCRVVDNSSPEHENIQVSQLPFTSTGSGSCGGGYHMNIPSIVGSVVGAAIIIGAIVVGLYVRRRRCAHGKSAHHHHTAGETTTLPEATTLPQATVMGYENKPVMAEVVHSHINDDKNTPPEKIPIV